MAVRIGNNIVALGLQRQLSDHARTLDSVTERLSSGLRINRASDDAAGLAISTKLNADARVFGQAIRNINDGLSVASIADSALSELSNIITRLAELAEQSANGVYGKQQRKALDQEAQALRNEYHRVVATTEFNGQGLLSTTPTTLNIQAGIGEQAVLSLSTQLETVSQSDVDGAINLDGINDYVEAASTQNLEYYGGALTLEGWINTNDADDGHIISKAWNGGGEYNYRFNRYATGYLGLAIVVPGQGSNMSVAYANSTVATQNGSWTHTAVTIDESGQNYQFFINGQSAGKGTLSFSTYTGLGNFNIPLAIGTLYPYGNGAWSQTNFSLQGSIDEVRISDSVRYTENFTPQNFAFVADSNTKALYHFEETSGTTTADASTNEENGTLMQSASFTANSAFSNVDYGPLFGFTLNTAEAARDALDKLKIQLDLMASARSKIGADQSRLKTGLANLETARENYLAAESRIKDADIAYESSQMIRLQILQKTAQSIAAQANQIPNLVLKLL